MKAGQIQTDPDFSTLAADQYTGYFELLKLVAGQLGQYYKKVGAGNSFEAGVVADFLTKFIASIKALRLKYSSNSHIRPLWVDLTESGFPNHAELAALEVDCAKRDEALRSLPATTALKRGLLDHIFLKHSDQCQLFEELAKRLYFENLNEDELFLPFTPGTLAQLRDSENGRSYVYPWASYDFSTNRPYIQILTFEQDFATEALHSSGEQYAEFLQVIKAEGCRAADLAVVAMAIDAALPPIHPKILKRVCIGPLYPQLLLAERATSAAREALLKQYLSDHSIDDQDFVLFFSDEIVFSKRQEISQSIFALRSSVREIFHIEEGDPECFARRASVVNRHVLMPHSILQHLQTDLSPEALEIKSCRAFSYNEEGQIYGI